MTQQPSAAFADPICDGASSRGLFRGHRLKIIHWNGADGYAALALFHQQFPQNNGGEFQRGFKVITETFAAWRSFGSVIA
jgi:hypothetical protein